MLIAQLTALAIHPAFGYGYDLFGRKKIIISSALILVVSVYIFPYTSPSIALLNCVYTVGFLLRCLKDANPLLIDYVKSNSRGKAIGLLAFGGIFGEIFC